MEKKWISSCSSCTRRASDCASMVYASLQLLLQQRGGEEVEVNISQAWVVKVADMPMTPGLL